MTINDYFEAQNKNLQSSLVWRPFSSVFPLVDDLYSTAIELIPLDYPPTYGRLLLVSHKSFLSAAALIGQAQPEDAGPITRRAIEAARLAATFKTDPKKIEEWLAIDQRMGRWTQRQEGSKPKGFHFNHGKAHAGISDVVDDLMALNGILSDSDVHLTPEFISQLAWTEGGGSLYLNYFVKEQSDLERSVIFTSAAHLRILEVFDWCFDGAFKSNPHWLKRVENLRKSTAPLTAKFEARSKATAET